MLSRTVLHCRGPLGRSWRASSGVVGVETAALPIPCSSTCGDSNRRQAAVTLLAPIVHVGLSDSRWLASTRSAGRCKYWLCARANVLAVQPQIAARPLGVPRGGVVRVLDAVHLGWGVVFVNKVPIWERFTLVARCCVAQNMKTCRQSRCHVAEN